MEKSVFWTVMKADLVFTVASMLVTVLVTYAFAVWRKNKLKAQAARKPEGPRAVILGGSEPKPGCCPLCGRDWPLPGPEVRG